MMLVTSKTHTPAQQELIVLTAQIYVCGYYGVKWDEISGPSRRAGVTDARHCFCWMLRTYTSLTVVEIARLINRHHSSVVNGNARIMKLLSVQDASTVRAINQFIAKIPLNK